MLEEHTLENRIKQRLEQTENRLGIQNIENKKMTKNLRKKIPKTNIKTACELAVHWRKICLVFTCNNIYTL